MEDKCLVSCIHIYMVTVESRILIIMTCLALSRQIIQRKRYCWLFHFCSIFVCRLCVCVYSSVCVCVCVYVCVLACNQDSDEMGDEHAGSRVVMVTGPNMGGKSTLMRQTGLIVILAQLVSCLSQSISSALPAPLLFHHPVCHTFVFSVLLFPRCHIILLFVISFSSLSFHSPLRHFILVFVISSSVFSVSSLSYNPLCHLILFVISSSLLFHSPLCCQPIASN